MLARKIALLGALSLSLVSLSACSLPDDAPLSRETSNPSTSAPSASASSDSPSESTSPSEEATSESSEDVSIFDVKVGDCLSTPSTDYEDGGVAETTKVSCDQPHTDEVYYDYNIPDAQTYPGEDAVSQVAEKVCGEQFEPFTGVAFEREAKFDYSYYTPTPESWEAGDRLITCIIFPLDENFQDDDIPTSTGSARGAGETITQ